MQPWSSARCHACKQSVCNACSLAHSPAGPTCQEAAWRHAARGRLPRPQPAPTCSNTDHVLSSVYNTPMHAPALLARRVTC